MRDSPKKKGLFTLFKCVISSTGNTGNSWRKPRRRRGRGRGGAAAPGGRRTRSRGNKSSRYRLKQVELDAHNLLLFDPLANAIQMRLYVRGIILTIVFPFPDGFLRQPAMFFAVCRTFLQIRCSVARGTFCVNVKKPFSLTFLYPPSLHDKGELRKLHFFSPPTLPHPSERGCAVALPNPPFPTLHTAAPCRRRRRRRRGLQMHFCSGGGLHFPLPIPLPALGIDPRTLESDPPP